jgi:hypothetical protein
MSVEKHTNKNWSGYIGIFIGVVGLFLTIFFNIKSVKVREPIFVVDSNRVVVVDFEHISSSPIKVVRKNNSEINGNINSVNLYFWNNGKLSIKPENILMPLKISLSGNNVEILNYKILKISRDITKIKLTRSVSVPMKTLDLDFKVLEENDGFVVQVIYLGGADVKFTMQGLIEDFRGEFGVENIKKSYILRSMFDKLSGFLVGLLLGIFVVSILGGYLKISEKFRFLEYINFAIGILVGLFFLVMGIYGGVIAPYKTAKSNISDYIIKNSPSTINLNFSSNQERK